MTQINIDLVTSCNAGDITIDVDKLRPYLATAKVGSILNSPYAGGPACAPKMKTGWDAAEWRQAVKTVQQEAAKLGVPPVLFGLDSIHGATYVRGSILLPQQLSMAAGFDRKAAYDFGFITARDTRAAAVPWLFSPILGISTQPLWPRVYETFGEDPLVAAELGVASIKGMQAPSTPGEYINKAAACAKHYIGYSDSRSGHDRAPAWIPKRHLLQYYAPPFEAAIDAGVMTVMESYSEIDGVPMASNKELLETLLRVDMNFTGMMVTDWAEARWLHPHVITIYGHITLDSTPSPHGRLITYTGSIKWPNRRRKR